MIYSIITDCFALYFIKFKSQRKLASSFFLLSILLTFLSVYVTGNGGVSHGIVYFVLFPLMGTYHVLLRTFVYALVILVVEYLSGYIIKRVSGKCPWHYDCKYAIHHLTCLDYIPFWMLFSYIAESYYLYF